jgi:UDP-2,3-diacylglucosamine hydrolase
MRKVSKKERLYPGTQEPFSDEKKERLAVFCNEYIKQDVDIDFFIFGHRHLPIKYTLKENGALYYNLGEWMYACSFGVADENGFALDFYKSDFDTLWQM